MASSVFGPADYALCALMLIISAGIGIYYRFTGGRQKTTTEYLLAGRSMGILPVSFSLMASFMSAVTLLGVSAENYTYGSMFVIINISYGIFTPVAAYCYLPVFFNLGATSVYEYLERRFGVTSRLVASLAFSLQMILYMGIVLYAPALALEAVTGLPKVWAILSVGLVCTFYSTIGGLKAVLITDVFQSLLMFAAVFSVIISAWIDKGSLLEIWQIAEEHGRIEFGNFDLDPTVRHTWWSLTIGGGVTFLSLYAVNQAQVQRYLAVKDIATAQRALWWNWPLLSLLSISTSFSGLAMFSRYYRCDPLSAKKISSSDQLMPYYVVDAMGDIPGLSGLFVSGIFSAALSTVSAAVNSLAAVTLEDYIKPAYRKIHRREFPEKGSSLKAKIISVVYGLVCIALAFVAQYLGTILQASLTIFGVVGGPILGFFTLGMFFPCANETGALAGLVTALAFSLWLGFSPKPPPGMLPVYNDRCTNVTSMVSAAHETLQVLSGTSNDDQYIYLHRLSYMWLGALGVGVCLLVGLVVSCLASYVLRIHSPHQSDSLDPNLFVPPVAYFLKKRKAHFCLAMNGNQDEAPINDQKKAFCDGDQDLTSSDAKISTAQTSL